MALVATRKPLLGNLLKHEYAANLGFCRQVVNVNITGGQEFTIGDILGKVTATGNYVPRDPAGVDGSEVSAGVVVENKTAADGVDTDLAILVRGPAVVGNQALTTTVTHTEGERATAIAELEALNIIVRTQI